MDWKKQKATWMVWLLAMCIPLLTVVNLMVGSVTVPTSEVISILLGRGSDVEIWQNIVIGTRWPQTLTAIFCGAGLAVAGLEMQTVFHNPLAGPSVLGISSSASLGVATMVLLGGRIGSGLMLQFGIAGNTALILAAIGGALLSLSLMMWLGHRVEGGTTLLIVGVLIGYIASAVTGVMKYFSNEEDVHAYVIWGLGTFARVTGGQVKVFAGLMGVMLPLSMLLAKPLNMLLLGERYATNLGLNIRRARMLIIFSSGTLTAIATAYCGPVMFLGLAVPHICRGLTGTADHRILLPATCFGGAALALVCNLVSRMPGWEGALPLNSVTALVGAPVALWVLLNRKNKYQI